MKKKVIPEAETRVRQGPDDETISRQLKKHRELSAGEWMVEVEKMIRVREDPTQLGCEIQIYDGIGPDSLLTVYNAIRRSARDSRPLQTALDAGTPQGNIFVGGLATQAISKTIPGGSDFISDLNQRQGGEAQVKRNLGRLLVDIHHNIGPPTQT